MAFIKPFVRITLLSTILAGLLIYLGIKYHWGDHLKPNEATVVELAIPETIEKPDNTDIAEAKSDGFNLDIVKNSDSSSTLLASMNKEQMAEQCINLLSKTIADEFALEVATANCVVSNYQETFQNNAISLEQTELIKKRKILFRKQCKNLSRRNTYNATESQLLIGICVSDLLTQQ